MSRAGIGCFSMAALVVLLGLGCSDVVKFGDGWSGIAKLEGFTRDCELSPLNNGKSIAVDQAGRVHIVYRMRRRQGDEWSGWDLLYKRLSPVEGGLDPDRQLVVAGDSSTHGQPCVATYGGSRVLVAWYQEMEGRPYILTSASNDGGTTWPGPTMYWSTTVDGSRPSADFDSRGKLHLAWRTRECTKYLRTDVNLTAVEQEKLVHSTYIVTTRQPSIVVDDSDCVHIGWSYAGFTYGYGVDYARSTDCGDSWTTTSIAGTGSGDEPPVSMAADHQGNAYVLWSGIRFRHSDDRGISWDSTQMIASGSYAAVAIGPQGYVHVVFERDAAIWYVTSNDHGQSWTQPFLVSEADAGVAKSPDIVVGLDGLVHVIWQQYDEDNGLHRLCYRVGK